MRYIPRRTFPPPAFRDALAHSLALFGHALRWSTKGRGEGVYTLVKCELSEGAGGAFGRLTLCNTAPSQQPLDCTHSKAHDFKEEGECGTKQIGV